MISVHKLPKAVKDRGKYGDAVARIVSKNPKLDKKFVFVKFDNDFSDDGLKEIHLEKGDKFVPIPLRKTTSRIYVSAPSGAGKSTWSAKMIEEYRRIFPDDRVFLISTVDQDDVLDKLEYIERVEIDDSLIGIPLDEFENSLIVFDDVGTISDKHIKKAVMNLRDRAAEKGRHMNISVLVTSHLFSNFSESRLMLLEARDLVVFPRAGAKTQIRKGLKNYVGLGDQAIDKIFALKSRWVQVRKSAPNFVLSERDFYLI